MKNKFWIIFILLIVFVAILLFFFNNKNNNSNSNYKSSKVSKNTYNEFNSSASSNENISTNNSMNLNAEIVQPKEEVISSFSTKIYNKDSARQNNINITCSTLNNTVIENGNIFSFCNTVRTIYNF